MDLSSAVYNFSLWLGGIFVFLWLSRALWEFRTLNALNQCVSAVRVVLLQELQSLGLHACYHHCQEFLKKRQRTEALSVSSVSVAGHCAGVSVQQSGHVTLTITNTAPCTVHIFIGVSRQSLRRLIEDCYVTTTASAAGNDSNVVKHRKSLDPCSAADRRVLPSVTSTIIGQLRGLYDTSVSVSKPGVSVAVPQSALAACRSDASLVPVTVALSSTHTAASTNLVELSFYTGPTLSLDSRFLINTETHSMLELVDVFGMPADPSNDNERDCTICMSDLKSVILLPCRHFCICRACLKSVQTQKCPICRAPIEDFMEYQSIGTSGGVRSKPMSQLRTVS